MQNACLCKNVGYEILKVHGRYSNPRDAVNCEVNIKNGISDKK